MGEPSYSLGTFFLRAPKGDLEESPQGTFFQSKHFRGIFNTSRSFSQKAAFLLQVNSFASQCVHLEYPWLNNQMCKPSTILPYKPVGSATSHFKYSHLSYQLSHFGSVKILDPNMASHAAPVPWSEKRLGNSVPNDMLLLKRRLLGDRIVASAPPCAQCQKMS